ncbi:MAG: succinate dehydrogenase, hydrophobic membrane anchor protein [Hyphomicrobiales bacterium]|nr:succinate dehydrogenase, hydrophobic membrane anchor protein [Hyphomicrobiales bacterium]
MQGYPDDPRAAAGGVRFLGSARDGTGDAWTMRVTSLALIPLAFGLVWTLASMWGRTYESARALMGEPLPALAVGLFCVVSALHMKVGMDSIVVDYVHGPRLREAALVANRLFCGLVAAACAWAIFKLATGRA